MCKFRDLLCQWHILLACTSHCFSGLSVASSFSKHWKDPDVFLFACDYSEFSGSIFVHQLIQNKVQKIGSMVQVDYFVVLVVSSPKDQLLEEVRYNQIVNLTGPHLYVGISTSGL